MQIQQFQQHKMSLTLYSNIFRIHVLLSIMRLFSVSKISYAISPSRDTSNGNGSKLFDQAYSQTTHGAKWPRSPNTTYGTWWTRPETDEGLFSWDHIMTAGYLQSLYCSRQCRGDALVTPQGEDFCFYLECFPCDCNKPLCEFYGSCCPDYIVPSVDSNTVSEIEPTETSQHLSNSKFDERTVHITKDTHLDLVCDGRGTQNYLFKRSCPASYPDRDVKSKCQNEVPTTEQDVDMLLHVTDDKTGYTYYNEHCATCNNVTQLTPWTLLVECMDFMTVLSSRTPAELLKLSLASNSGCNTRQEAPSNHQPYTCDRCWFSEAVVDTCNVTGEWDVYDTRVVKSCASISGLVNRVRTNTDSYGTLYKNLFCAICNMQDYPDFGIYCGFPNKDLVVSRPELRLPFSVLLNFGSHGKLTPRRREGSKCSGDSHWRSPDNKCLPLECSPGKILTNGSCSTALSQIRGLLYQMHIYYVPSVSIEMTLTQEHTSDIQQAYLRSLMNHLKQFMSLVGYEFQISLTVIFWDTLFPVCENQTTNEQINTSRVFQIACFTVDGFIQSQDIFDRDVVETFLVIVLIQNNLTVDIHTNTTLTLMPLLDPHRHQTRAHCPSVYKETPTCISSSITFASGHFQLVSKKYIRDALIIEPHLKCDFVKFGKTEYFYDRQITTKSQRSSMSLLFQRAKITFYERAELNMASIDEDGTLRICHELLNTTYSSYDESINNTFLRLSLYTLTLICIISSIICLTITLMTYFMFPVLRTLAGKNNIFLCLSLLMAQMSLLVTSHVPETSQLCTVLAMCTHFLWLAMFCWCFTCCYHMFCVFSAKMRSNQDRENSEMMYVIKRIVACSVIPGLTVGGVVATNYIISGRRVSGYGNTTCFLHSRIHLILTLVAPLCLILLFNFIFFSITVIKIYKVRKLQTREFRKDDRNNLYVYIKLSSMTGIFWILSVISEATDNDPLRFIAIGLNGLQGVFIFLSYICNRRVLRLYQKFLGLEEYATTTTTPGRCTSPV